jgi:hypothetical protein
MASQKQAHCLVKQKVQELSFSIADRTLVAPTTYNATYWEWRDNLISYQVPFFDPKPSHLTRGLLYPELHTMFQRLKEGFSDVRWQLTSDELDKTLSDLVSQGTNEQLISPDWAVNMALVDKVNRDPV